MVGPVPCIVSSSPTIAARLRKLKIGSRLAPPPGGVPDIYVSWVGPRGMMLIPLEFGEASKDEIDFLKSLFSEATAESVTDDVDDDALERFRRWDGR